MLRCLEGGLRFVANTPGCWALTRSAASEGGSVRGSPCDESARLRLTSLRPHSFGLLRSPEAAKRRVPPFTGDTPGTFLSQVAR